VKQKKRRPIVGIPRMIVVGLLIALLSALFASGGIVLPLYRYSVVLPDAYRVPKVPGGTALRLAMVHDVLHERYLRHGTAWYRQRNRDARQFLASEPATQPVSDRYLDAMDDLAVGEEQVGEFSSAIELMRHELEVVGPLPPLPDRTGTPPDDSDPEAEDLNRILAAKNLTPLQHHQYTACANLGTILLIDALNKAGPGDQTTKPKLQESLDLIERAGDQPQWSFRPREMAGDSDRRPIGRYRPSGFAGAIRCFWRLIREITSVG
jgi:hypothetical protein